MKGAAEVLFRAHIEDLRVRGLAEASMGAARYVVPRLFSHLREQGVHDLRTVKEEHVISFARELATRVTKRGGTLTLSTQRTYLGAVRRFFCFLVREEVLLEEPSRGLVLPRTERLPRFIPSEAQVARLMAAPGADTALGLRDRAILELLYGTGLRLSECSRLDLTDVDLAAMTVLVRNGKGKKDRLLPIPARAGEALDAYLRRARSLLSRDPSERALFLSRDATRLTRTAIQLAVKWHGIGAGLPHLSPHALRHACGTHLIRGGADLRHVQELLGHERIQTTAIYTSLDLSDLRTALEKCHPRERGLRKPA